MGWDGWIMGRRTGRTKVGTAGRWVRQYEVPSTCTESTLTIYEYLHVQSCTERTEGVSWVWRRLVSSLRASCFLEASIGPLDAERALS